MKMNKLTLAVSALALLSTAALTSLTAFASEGDSVMVAMKSVDGADLGYITIKEAHNGVVVQSRMEGVPAGWHGFHIHEVGSCADSFKAAKGHYNPGGVSHGINHGEGRHGGDLPNVYAGDNGKVRADFFTQNVTLADGPTTLNDADGSSFIVHAKADSYGEKAGAGGRIACGVISTAK